MIHEMQTGGRVAEFNTRNPILWWTPRHKQRFNLISPSLIWFSDEKLVAAWGVLQLQQEKPGVSVPLPAGTGWRGDVSNSTYPTKIKSQCSKSRTEEVSLCHPAFLTSFSPGVRQPQAQALRDVEKALQIFENTRKIPTSVIEARYCVLFNSSWAQKQ